MKNAVFGVVLCIFSMGVQAQLQFGELPSGTAAVDGQNYFRLFDPVNAGAGENTDCYSLVTYFERGGQRGFYVLDLPRHLVPSGGYLFLGGRLPATSAAEEAGVVRVDWNSPEAVDHGLVVRRYVLQRDGSYSVQRGPVDEELMPAQHNAVITLLYRRGQLVSGRVGDRYATSLPLSVSSLPELSIPGNCGLVRISPASIAAVNVAADPVFARNGNGILTYTGANPANSRIRTEAELVWLQPADRNLRNFELEQRTGEGSWTTVAYTGALAPDSRSSQTVGYLYGGQNDVTGSQYRLQQIEMNNRTTYSPLQTADASAAFDANAVRVYPNPSTDGRINIMFGREAGLRDVQLIDMGGRLVQQWVSVNNNRHQVDNIPRGNYVLRIINRVSGTVSSEKIVVTR